MFFRYKTSSLRGLPEIDDHQDNTGQEDCAASRAQDIEWNRRLRGINKLVLQLTFRGERFHHEVGPEGTPILRDGLEYYTQGANPEVRTRHLAGMQLGVKESWDQPV